MGKGARLRRQRALRGNGGAGSRHVSAGGLKVGVITYPRSTSSGPSLTRDSELVRAALLYADEIELISPGAAMLAGVMQLAEGGTSSLIELLAEFDDEAVQSLGGRTLPQNWREVLPLATFAAQLDPALLRSLPGGAQIDVDGLSALREKFVELENVAGEVRDVTERMLVCCAGNGRDK